MRSLGASFPLALALRYLRSTRRDAFVSFLSVVAAAGIGLGVAALVVALAALTGMQRTLKGEILARTPALDLQLPGGIDAAEVARRVRALDGVVQVQGGITGSGWLVAGGRALEVEITGFEGPVPPHFPGAAGFPPGLYLADRLAARSGLRPGDVAELVSPLPTLSPFGPQPRSLAVPVSGTFRAGRVESVLRVALPIDRAEVLFGKGRNRHLFVTARSLDEALGLAARIAAVVPPQVRVATWRELNRPLFFALRLEKTVLFLAVSLVVLVAALALVADLALIAANKRRELGMLMALGAGAPSLRRAFVWLGGMLGGIGAVAGATLGAAVAVVLDRTRLVRMPSGVYFVDYLPFAVPLGDLALVVGVTMLLALACAVYGAERATRLLPVEALRA